MVIEWDVPIDMDDGLQLRADIFRPIGAGALPGAAVRSVGGSATIGSCSHDADEIAAAVAEFVRGCCRGARMSSLPETAQPCLARSTRLESNDRVRYC